MQHVLVLGVQRSDLLYHKRLQLQKESDIDELQLAALFTGLYHSRPEVDGSLLESDEDGISVCRKNDSLWYSRNLCNDTVNGPTVLALHFDLTILTYGPCIEIAKAFSKSVGDILVTANKQSLVIDSYKSAQARALEAHLTRFRSFLPDQIHVESISTWKEVTISKETKAAPLPRQPSTNNPATTTNSPSSSLSGSCFDCFRKRRVDTSHQEYRAVVALPSPRSGEADTAEEPQPRPQIEVVDYVKPMQCCVTYRELLTWRPQRHVIFTALHTCSTDTATTTSNDDLNIIHDSTRSTTIIHKCQRKIAMCNAHSVRDASLFLLTTNGTITLSGREAVLREFMTILQQSQSSMTIKQLVFDIISIYRVSEQLGGVFSIAQKQLLLPVAGAD